MPLIVDIKNRIATGNRARIVCGNSDYVVKFIFDEEWDNYSVKTAIFKWGKDFGISRRVPFEGDTCEVPQMLNTLGFKVGVFAGDLRCTTPAFFGADPCVLCDTEEQDPPPEDVYNEIMDLINKAVADPELIKKVCLKTIREDDVVYDWCIVPNKYIFRDVVVNDSETIMVYQLPEYNEPLFIEIEGTTYNAVWKSENVISNDNDDATVTINEDETITIVSDIDNCVVSLYKTEDIAPVIIPGSHLPIASEDSVGGVKPVAKTEEMTQPVGVDETGALFVKSGVSEKELLLILEGLDIAHFASSDGHVLYTDSNNKIYVL